MPELRRPCRGIRPEYEMHSSNSQEEIGTVPAFFPLLFYAHRRSPWDMRFPLCVESMRNSQQVRLLLDSDAWELLLCRCRLHIAPHDIHLEGAFSVTTTGSSAQLSWPCTNISLGQSDLRMHKVVVADADADPDLDGFLGFADMDSTELQSIMTTVCFRWSN